MFLLTCQEMVKMAAEKMEVGCLAAAMRQAHQERAAAVKLAESGLGHLETAELVMAMAELADPSS